MQIIDPCMLTPVELINGIYFKREDYFAPVDVGGINGGKCRQCYLLIKKALSSHPYKGVITCCSIHSPQGPIVAGICKLFNIPCVIYYGGTTEDRLNSLPMPSLAKSYGAELHIVSKFGRHSVLYSIAAKFAKANDYYIVEYGINLEKNKDVLIDSISQQVENIPNHLKNLYVVCGSGISISGIILGLKKYNKSVDYIHIICTAPDRSRLIETICGEAPSLIIHDLYHRKGFKYETRELCEFGGITLHPNYEAKAMNYIIDNNLDLTNSLFWIVGAEPK